MSRLKKAGAVAGILLLALCVGQMSARDSNGDARSEIDAFNKRFTELHLKMDTPGIMAMWAEDGVDLMQGESPIVGRKTITAWIENILSRVPGYKVTKRWNFATSKCAETGQASGPRNIRWRRLKRGSRTSRAYGKMALVLHREANGEWKIKQEMWNASPKP